VFFDGRVQNLKDLQKDDTIVIINPDKGYRIVVLDRANYINMMHDILSDESAQICTRE
jgi:hypothetical protein